MLQSASIVEKKQPAERTQTLRSRDRVDEVATGARLLRGELFESNRGRPKMTTLREKVSVGLFYGFQGIEGIFIVAGAVALVVLLATLV